LATGVAVLVLAGSGVAAGADLYRPGAFPALAADRRAASVGDVLTVLVLERSTASNSASSGAHKASHMAGAISADGAFSHNGALDLSSGFDGDGQSSRAHQMAAQISVVVEEVLPNGDLRVSGAQAMKINGERANIRVRGRVRPQDIAADNTVLSTRLADAAIDFDGKGFVSSSARAGIISRVIAWLGLP
jgi:flagellar L-ring protein precursor FlgH